MLGPTEDALAPAARWSGEALDTVHRNELRLLKLVNNLLDFARIEANRAQASYQATDLDRDDQDLASGFRAAIESAGIELLVAAVRWASPCSSTATCGRRSSSTCCRTRSSSRSTDRSR
jgi:signal transduction histidine kinase